MKSKIFAWYVFFKYLLNLAKKKIGFSNDAVNDFALPWMHDIEIKIIVDILKKYRPQSCLEWGCGASTLYYPKFLKFGGRWLSIEHSEDWYNSVQFKNKRENVTLVNIKPNNLPWTDNNKDGSYEDLFEYVDYPEKIGKFDFILIDGRARIACIQKAFDLISLEGIVVLHDANREYYHDSLDKFPYQDMFLYSRGIWIGSKSKLLLDLELYKKMWNMYSKKLEDLNLFVNNLKKILVKSDDGH